MTTKAPLNPPPAPPQSPRSAGSGYWSGGGVIYYGDLGSRPGDFDPLKKPHGGSLGLAFTKVTRAAVDLSKWDTQLNSNRVYARWHPAIRFVHGALLNWAGGRLFYKALGLSANQAIAYGGGIAAADYLSDDNLGLIGQIGLAVAIAGAVDKVVNWARGVDFGRFAQDPAGYLAREVRMNYPTIDTTIRYYQGAYSGVVSGPWRYWTEGFAGHWNQIVSPWMLFE